MKQSGNKASSDAAWLLRKVATGDFYWRSHTARPPWIVISSRVARVAASVLSQDETKGKRRKVRK